MPNLQIFVDSVQTITTTIGTQMVGSGLQTPAMTTIYFRGGQTAQLDMRQPQAGVWIQVLDSLRQENEPAYVEVDPATNLITRLLCPKTVRVTAITPLPGRGVEVELEVSQARHRLHSANSDFARLLATLQIAQTQGTTVLVTETLNTHEIIDVRPLLPFVAAVTTTPVVPGTGGGLPGGPAAAAIPSVVTAARAQDLFDLVCGATCNPVTPTAPCIPFLYPDDGCWGRAHEMCRLILGQGEVPEKVWIYGRLDAASRNHPACMISWSWHVAPTLLVKDNGSTDTQVLDPSLFSGPVSQATWFASQGDPAATIYTTTDEVFHRTATGAITYDLTYVQSNIVLARYRRDLMLRSASPDGPPPYAHCP